MVRSILQIGDPVLESKSKNIDPKEINSSKTQGLIDDLIDTVISEVERSAGISAPQVGENLNIFIARRFDLQKNEGDDKNIVWEVIINPEIVQKSDNESVYWEGCLSVGVGEKALFAPIKRRKKTKIKFLTREGKVKNLTGIGFMSHVFQHEIDHLNGVLFLAHVKNPENIWTSKELDKYIKEHGDYPAFVELPL